jgi:hypothetical protein
VPVLLEGDAVFAASGDEVFGNITSGVGDIVTAVAVVVGGLWAYFKFVRGRTYKPRLSVHIGAQWRKPDGIGDALHVRVRVTNIGASKVSLNQYGTGLIIAFPAVTQHLPPDDIVWEPVLLREGQERWFEIFKEHSWIEPNETVSDDLLLSLDRPPTIAKLEVRLIWAEFLRAKSNAGNGFRANDIQVFARVVLPPDATIGEPAS